MTEATTTLTRAETDLHRWRETFAEKLRERGVEAEATRQAARGATRNHPDLWRVKAAGEGRLLKPRSTHRRGAAVGASRAEARRAWQTIAAALAQSGDAGDRKLAAAIDRFSRDTVPSSERLHADHAQGRSPGPVPGDRSR